MRVFKIAAVLGCIGISSAIFVPNSRRMLDGIVSRKQGEVDSGAVTNTLESATLSIAMDEFSTQYPHLHDQYAAYLGKVIDIGASLLSKDPKTQTDVSMDRYALAVGMKRAEKKQIPLLDATRQMYATINASMGFQQRNDDDSFWYTGQNPHLDFLDGMISLLPFMASQPHVNYTEMSLQIGLLNKHCSRSSGLLVHGYDPSRQSPWVHDESSSSLNVWGRSLGWFVSGLVQAYELLPCKTSHDPEARKLCSQIQHLVQRIAGALRDHADKETGAWFQVVDMQGREGNYLESSCTALYTFSLFKAVRLGMICPSYLKVAHRAYDYSARHFTTDTGNGTFGYDKTVAVCRLGSPTTYEYYVARPLVPNSLLGESAFILASLEVERLHGQQ